jgi:hypothetical protein
MSETLYEGPAHDATFHLPVGGIVRFTFDDQGASGYVRSTHCGAMIRVVHASQLFLSGGQHVLTLNDPNEVMLVSITLEGQTGPAIKPRLLSQYRDYLGHI